MADVDRKELIGIAGTIALGKGVTALQRQANAAEESNSIQQAQLAVDFAKAQLQKNANSLNAERNQLSKQHLELQFQYFHQDLEMKKALVEEFKSEHETRRLKEAEEERKTEINDLLRDIIFSIDDEIETIITSHDHNIYKYWQLLKIQALIDNLGISTKTSREFSDKKLINKILKKLTQNLDDLEASFTEEERKDVEAIFQILKVDEEAEIDEANEELKKERRNGRTLSRRLAKYEDGTTAFQLPKKLDQLHKKHKEKEQEKDEAWLKDWKLAVKEHGENEEWLKDQYLAIKEEDKKDPER